MNDKQDEFAGQGGSYLVGKDGKRTLVHRTQEPQPQAPAAPVDADDTIPPSAAKKGR